MDEFKVKKIELGEDPATDSAVLLLIEDALGRKRFLPDFEKRINYASGTTIVLGGYIGDRLVCMSVFMRLSFSVNSTGCFGYQCGFNATSSDCRGLGLWPKLMKYSEKYLMELGAEFIYVFPNSTSLPLYLKKLDFESFDMHRMRITPGILLAKLKCNLVTCRCSSHHDSKAALRPALQESFVWKTHEYGAEKIKQYRFGKSVAWGRKKTTVKSGLKVKFFEIGGFEASCVNELKGLLTTICRGERVIFCSVSLNEGSEYFPLFNSISLEEEPLVIKMLGDLKTSNLSLNFFSGLRDTF
ncbi:MAG: GNAT family N-acetyltransferase [Granulosicoccus sp.]